MPWVVKPRGITVRHLLAVHGAEAPHPSPWPARSGDLHEIPQMHNAADCPDSNHNSIAMIITCQASLAASVDDLCKTYYALEVLHA